MDKNGTSFAKTATALLRGRSMIYVRNNDLSLAKMKSDSRMKCSLRFFLYGKDHFRQSECAVLRRRRQPHGWNKGVTRSFIQNATCFPNVLISAHVNQNAKLERAARLDDTILLMHYSPWLKRNNL